MMPMMHRKHLRGGSNLVLGHANLAKWSILGLVRMRLACRIMLLLGGSAKRNERVQHNRSTTHRISK
eukprot:15391726-Alexandrium_andersonii.AAC.1